MEEAEWWSSTDPQAMLAFLRDSGKLSERKVRLFLVGCCRRVWKELRDERSRQAVVVAERYADDLATAAELDVASDAASDVWEGERERASTGRGTADKLGNPLPYSAAAYNVAIPLGWWGAAPAFVAPYQIILRATSNRGAEATGQCVALRDIFGPLPFRPLSTIDPAVLAWHDSTVVRLAQGAYQERELPSGHLDSLRLRVLADALEEAGCTDQEIVGHLREPGPHSRGCYVLDLLLDKK